MRRGRHCRRRRHERAPRTGGTSPRLAGPVPLPDAVRPPLFGVCPFGLRRGAGLRPARPVRRAHGVERRHDPAGTFRSRRQGWRCSRRFRGHPRRGGRRRPRRPVVGPHGRPAAVGTGGHGRGAQQRCPDGRRQPARGPRRGGRGPGRAAARGGGGRQLRAQPGEQQHPDRAVAGRGPHAPGKRPVPGRVRRAVGNRHLRRRAARRGSGPRPAAGGRGRAVRRAAFGCGGNGPRLRGTARRAGPAGRGRTQRRRPAPHPGPGAAAPRRGRGQRHERVAGRGPVAAHRGVGAPAARRHGRRHPPAGRAVRHGPGRPARPAGPARPPARRARPGARGPALGPVAAPPGHPPRGARTARGHGRHRPARGGPVPQVLAHRLVRAEQHPFLRPVPRRQPRLDHHARRALGHLRGGAHPRRRGRAGGPARGHPGALAQDRAGGLRGGGNLAGPLRRILRGTRTAVPLAGRAGRSHPAGQGALHGRRGRPADRAGRRAPPTGGGRGPGPQPLRRAAAPGVAVQGPGRRLD